MDVRDAAGDPIPDACVTVYQPVDWLPVVLPRRQRTTAQTGTDGSCELDIAGCEMGDLITAVAPGYLPDHVSLPPGQSEVTIRLGPGLSISGQVVDRMGRPVPGLRLVARHNDLPAGLDTSAIPTSPALAVARATSDDSGRFVLTGLAPGRNRVEPDSPDWRLVPPRNILQTLSGSLPVAGDQDLRLVVERVGVIRLLLRDEAADTPVSAADITVAVLECPHVYGELLRFDARRPGESAGDRATIEEATDVLIGRVALKAAADAVVPILVRAKGYEPVRTEVPLVDEGRGHVASKVALRPTTTAPRGSLMIRCPRSAEAFERPAACFCSLRSADAAAVLRGTRAAASSDTWLFHGVPAGPLEIQVWDGISKSEPMRIDVDAGHTKLVEVALPAPTGAVMRLWGPDGRRVFNADLLIFKDGAGVSSANHASATACGVNEAGSPADFLVPLAPGRQTFGVIKSGYLDGGGAVLLEEGRVQSIDVVMEPRLP